MKFTVLLKEEVDLDILEATYWYDHLQKGLALRFLHELEIIFTYLESNPYLFQEKQLGFREAPLKSFPFVVFYRIEKKKVFVFAVFNCKKDPKKKIDRTK